MNWTPRASSEPPLAILRADTLFYIAAIGAALAAILGAGIAASLVFEGQAAAAVLFYLALAAIVRRAAAGHLPHPSFGAANTITLARGAAVAALAGIAVGPVTPVLLWVAATVALVSIALDGLDGFLARRHGVASRFGARFDMEIDALLILTLAILLVVTDKTGAWLVIAGAARYLFVAAGRFAPALKAPLPYSERRRAICVVQGLTLAIALAPAVPAPLAAMIAGAGLAATLYSFAVDIVWLVLRTPHPSSVEQA